MKADWESLVVLLVIIGLMLLAGLLIAHMPVSQP